MTETPMGRRRGPGRGETTARPAPDPRLADALAQFSRERTWLLPALHAVQEAVGYLPDSALAEVAGHLRVPASEVWGVATGYPEFRLAARGRHHVRVCTGVSCALTGGRELLDAVARRHGVKPGETGAERELTLESADCFFECSMAPLLEVDGACRGRVRPEDVAHLDRWFRRPSGDRHGTPIEAREGVPPAAGSAGAFLDR